MLIKAGADVNATNIYGNTALDIVLSKSNIKGELLEILTEAGAKSTKINQDSLNINTTTQSLRAEKTTDNYFVIPSVYTKTRAFYIDRDDITIEENLLSSSALDGIVFGVIASRDYTLSILQKSLISAIAFLAPLKALWRFTNGYSKEDIIKEFKTDIAQGVACSVASSACASIAAGTFLATALPIIGGFTASVATGYAIKEAISRA